MKKLSVLGKKVTVKIKAPTTPESAGEYHHNLGLILISPECENKSHTLFHEVAHAYWDRAGLFQGIRNQPVEEIFCETLASFLSENIITLYQMHNKLTKKTRKK